MLASCFRTKGILQTFFRWFLFEFLAVFGCLFIFLYYLVIIRSQLHTAMQKTPSACTEKQALRASEDILELKLLNLKDQGDSVMRDMISSSCDCGRKSEATRSSYNTENNKGNGGVNFTGHIEKNMFSGSVMERKGRASAGNDSKDDTDIGLSPEIKMPSQSLGVLPSNSLFLNSSLVKNYLIFTIGDIQQSEKGQENSDTQFSGEDAGESGERTHGNLPAIVRSSSLPNIDSSVGSSVRKCMLPLSRSYKNFNVPELRQKQLVFNEDIRRMAHDSERDDCIVSNEKNNSEHLIEDGYGSCNHVGSAEDWIIHVNDANAEENIHGKSSVHRWEKMPTEDVKIKRIEEWISNLRYGNPLEETINGSSNLDDHRGQEAATTIDNLNKTRLGAKDLPGAAVAKTIAHLPNHGLVTIPFLRAFVSLKTLNLSGNSIARITAGALPRGLHSLNLSKNNISIIDGLRELTRLRVLDLSYNRIVRIGHGLASCSSLKEFYLGGNKITEVEGLHRLLKLNVLDLRFNKISTTKCLGQLAANCYSLQVLSLEGNPVQKNVGDEQLKKYLEGILPHLAYFNRQSIKAGSMKDVVDRSARMGITANRGLRSEHKNLRYGKHSASIKNISFSSSLDGLRNQAVVSPRLLKGKLRRHLNNFVSKHSGFRSARRNQIERTLVAR
ncbi:hypothetical protein NMG60_11035507 [Bertholletia excelsa]